MSDPVHPSLDSSLLGHLVDCLGHALAVSEEGFLVHVVAAPDGPNLGILPLDGQAPVDVMLGLVAPEHWSAIGVATRGRALPLDRSASGDGPAGAEVVVLVTRDGQVVSRVRQGNRVLTEPPGSGLALDCLRRALGLPTDPPETLPSHLLSVIWLDRVVRAARGRRQPLRWGRITRLHPAVELMGGDTADPLPAVEELDRSFDWARLRQLVMGSGWPVFGLTPEEAAWFDEGSLSRWVLGQWPSLPFLVEELRRTLPTADARRCIRLLRRLGVDSTSA